MNNANVAVTEALSSACTHGMCWLDMRNGIALLISNHGAGFGFRPFPIFTAIVVLRVFTSRLLLAAGTFAPKCINASDHSHDEDVQRSHVSWKTMEVALTRRHLVQAQFKRAAMSDFFFS